MTESEMNEIERGAQRPSPDPDNSMHRHYDYTQVAVGGHVPPDVSALWVIRHHQSAFSCAVCTLERVRTPCAAAREAPGRVVHEAQTGSAPGRAGGVLCACLCVIDLQLSFIVDTLIFPLSMAGTGA